MYTPEDRQKHVGRARTTSYERQIRLLCITWLPVVGAGQSRSKQGPSARETGCADNLCSSEERHFIFNHLK